jgi:hypothetical protein
MTTRVLAIIAAPEYRRFEDVYLRRLLAQRRDLVGVVRTDRNFVYNIQGGNLSTGTWLEP